MIPSSTLRQVVALTGAVVALQGIAGAQSRDDMRFSITWRGPTIGVGGITAGDILMPQAPGTAFSAPPPAIAVSAGTLGLSGSFGCVAVPGRPCGVDVDALSSGQDVRPQQLASSWIGVQFSVDRYAIGGAVPNVPPSVSTETLFDDHGADVFRAPWPGRPDPAQPIVPGRNSISVDGDGDARAGGLGAFRPGSGLREPNNPGAGWPINAHDRGDDLDALDLGSEGNSFAAPFYFSLVGGLIDLKDPAGAPSVPNPAEIEGVSAADVLVAIHPLRFERFARASQLGLHPVRDDVDALIMASNGVPGFQRSPNRFGWSDPDYDMVLFSVRRGSGVIGTTDSELGLPIAEGDLLAPPAAGASAPAIVVTAESLGLWCQRTGRSGDCDDLDAASMEILEFPDCNNNFIEDRLDIVDGTSDDVNGNNIPDECEYVGEPYCTCPSGANFGCSNASFWTGCRNHTGVGGALQCIGPADQSDQFQLVAMGLPPAATFVLAYSSGNSVPAQSGNGLRCLTGRVKRVGSSSSVPANGTVVAPMGTLAGLGTAAPMMGQTGHFQLIYRDVPGPCGSTVNWTNALAIGF